MAKIKKSLSISKQTESKKLNKVSKQKLMNENKSQSAIQPFCMSLKLKPVEGQEKMIEFKEEEIQNDLSVFESELEVEVEEEEATPQVYFGTGSPFVQSLVLCHILSNHLSLFEQIEMRRVCRLWHYNVKHIWAKTRSLVLTLKNKSMKPKLSANLHKPKPENVDNDQFYFLDIAKKFDLAIGKNHWNRATIDLLGDLFRNVEHLTIFYELCDEFDYTDNLCYFLQKFTKVKAFSLIMSPVGTVREDFLSRLFKTINDKLAPLHTLHLYLPNNDFSRSVNRQTNVDFKHFHKTLSYLQNFSLNSTVENLSEILHCMGKSLPARWPIQSLSINVSLDKFLSPVKSIFEQNPNLSHIKRLELTGLSAGSLNIVNCLLGHFKELESLSLCACLHSNKIKFTFYWIESLSSFHHLQELYLWNYEIQIFNNWSNKGFEKSLPNIRKLTIVASYNLYYSVKLQYYHINNLSGNQEVESKSIYGLYLHNLAKQFPKLERLTIRRFTVGYNENFPDWCFTEFDHLKSVRLVDEFEDSVYKL